MDTKDSHVKKGIFELLSALCVYSADGYNRALEALEHYKKFKSERYRFRIVLSELQAARNAEYKTVLLAFINCLIISTPQLKDRNRLRNEFIGLKLNDVIKKERENSNSGMDASDLQVSFNIGSNKLVSFKNVDL